MIRTLELQSQGRWFHSWSRHDELVSITWMGNCLQKVNHLGV